MVVVGVAGVINETYMFLFVFGSGGRIICLVLLLNTYEKHMCCWCLVPGAELRVLVLLPNN